VSDQILSFMLMGGKFAQEYGNLQKLLNGASNQGFH